MNSINKLIRTFFLTGLVLVFSTSCGEEETVTDTSDPCVALLVDLQANSSSFDNLEITDEGYTEACNDYASTLQNFLDGGCTVCPESSEACDGTNDDTCCDELTQDIVNEISQGCALDDSGDGDDSGDISLEDLTCETTASSPTAVFGSENPYKPMNIYVYEAKVTVSNVSFNFPSGSVVAVYDGSTCVGTFTLTDEIGSAPISITAGADDGSSNGFTDGNDIMFKIWYNNCEFDATATFLDSDSNATEAVSFSQQGTAFVNLSITQ